MAESKQNPWWRQKSWWIPGTLLLVLVVVDLVAAFRFASDKDLRSSILSLLIPLVALIAGMAALLNFQEARRQNERTFETTQHQLELARDQVAQAQERNRVEMELQRRGQVTERFTKAIEQLGNDKLDVRLGAIYALEQIARDSEELHWPIIQVLTAYLREHSAGADWKEERERAMDDSPATPRARADFLAVADVIRRRRWQWDSVASVDDMGRVWHEPLNFEGCDLGHADLGKAQLERANFAGAEVEQANFQGAQLEGASFEAAELEGANFEAAQLQGAIFEDARVNSVNFQGAQLPGAHFWGAQLQRTNFGGAHLEGANFPGAHLQGTNFEGAELKGANFTRSPYSTSGTDLSETEGLNQGQLDLAVCEESTKPPSGLMIKVRSGGDSPKQQGASPT